jgi:hypothetical protein
MAWTQGLRGKEFLVSPTAPEARGVMGEREPGRRHGTARRPQDAAVSRGDGRRQLGGRWKGAHIEGGARRGWSRCWGCWGNLHEADGQCHQADESRRRSDGHLDEDSGDGATATLAAGADVPHDYEQDAQKEGRCGRRGQTTERSQTELACRAVIHATWSLQDEQKELEEPSRRTQGEGHELRQARVAGARSGRGERVMKVAVYKRDTGEEAPRRSQRQEGPDRDAERRGSIGCPSARASPMRVQEVDELEGGEGGAQGGSGGGGDRVPHCTVVLGRPERTRIWRPGAPSRTRQEQRQCFKVYKNSGGRRLGGWRGCQWRVAGEGSGERRLFGEQESKAGGRREFW